MYVIFYLSFLVLVLICFLNSFNYTFMLVYIYIYIYIHIASGGLLRNNMRSRISLVFLFWMLCSKPSHSQDEEEECKDLDPNCYRLATFCDHPHYKQFAKLNCPVTCKFCPKDIDPMGLCRTNRGGCEHECKVEDKRNKICSCLPGYTLTLDKHNCTDTDECSLGEKLCLYGQCENLPGGFECQEGNCGSGERSYFKRAECCKKEPKKTKCGVTHRPDKRIVGGNDSFLGQWPWQVYINIDKSILCGGTLISRNWVVTAGHCFRGHSSKTEIKLFFGILFLNHTEGVHAQTRKPKRHILYPGWNEKKFELNDIALIELDSPVKFTNFVKPVCLPQGEKPKVGTKCFAAGWGLADEDSTAPQNTLQFVDLPIVDNAKCTKAYRKEETKFNGTNMMCAGYDEGGKDACRGDSGGPFVCQRCSSCGWYLAGVVSFGSGCAAKGFYGVYANVPHFEQWISEKTGIPVTSEKSCDGPYFSQWSAWSSCTKSCGKGATRERKRECRNRGKISTECRGSYKQTENCRAKSCPTLGKFGEWSDCTLTCDEGVRTRMRECLNGEIGQDGCPIDKAGDTEECNSHACPFWGDWTSWSHCTKTCGTGEEKRSRKCVGGKPDQKGCDGKEEEKKNCNEERCPGWSEWGSWATCSLSCGGGKQGANRDCIGKGCVGSSTREKNCNMQRCPTLRNWSIWTPCDATCGGGKQTRKRSCENGKIGDIGCEKTRSEEESKCNSQNCPRFGPWSSWGKCSVSCGGGTQTARRECEFGKVSQAGCDGPTSKSQGCSNEECIGKFGKWSSWTSCSQTCGTGNQEKKRTCKGGTKCIGDEKEVKSCKIKECPVFDEWTVWEKCSETCGGGRQSRSRECLHTNNPDECEGEPRESRDCNQKVCPGKWTDWSKWTKCDVTCGEGTIHRRRSCENGKVGRPNCDDGPEEETKSCAMKDCPSRWGQWGRWSGCSKTCDRGLRSRRRPCDGGRPGQGDCTPISAQMEEESCNEVICTGCFDNILENCAAFTTEICETYFEYSQLHCPVSCNICPGLYEHWGNWEPCSSTCGPGVRERTRVCKDERIGCDGSPSEVERCQGSCRGFDEWSAWTRCTKSCGGGRRTRSRTCSFEICQPDEDGNDSLSDEENCNRQACAGTWENWGEWGKCSKTCGNDGVETRSRKCHGGKCDGDAEETRNCRRMKRCPGSWDNWTMWSQCSVTCGRGNRMRTRECKNGDVGKPDCLGISSEETPCDAGECLTAKWGLWSKWEQCDQKCMRSRTRDCDRGKRGDPGCEGDAEESEKCDSSLCKVDGPCDPSLTDKYDDCALTDTRNCFFPSYEADCKKTCCEVLSELPCEDNPANTFECSWYIDFCNDARYEDTFRPNCRKTCKFCTP